MVKIGKIGFRLHCFKTICLTSRLKSRKILQISQSQPFLFLEDLSGLINDFFVVPGIGKNTSDLLGRNPTLILHIIFLILFMRIHLTRSSVFLFCLIIDLFLIIFFRLYFIRILFMIVLNFHRTLTALVVQVIDGHEGFCHVQVTPLVLVAAAL